MQALEEFAIEFGRGADSARHCVSGWSTPETGETWCIGPQSQMLLPVPTRQASYVLNLTLRPFTVERRLPAQRLRVLANGVPVGVFSIDRRTIRTCVIPWSAIAAAAELRLTFETPDAARPSAFAASADNRQLALAFSRLWLYADLFEAWQADALLNQNEPFAVDMASVQAVDQIPLHDLMLQFESLGQNCEFGLVQRQCQAEPLGLLRFSSTPLPQLLDALAARFEGMGTPATTTVALSPNGREYMVQDSRFGFTYHAWVNAGEMAPEDVAKREVRRVPFLVRKLVEDLEAGEKTFIFKGMAAMPEEEVFPLAMALRRYGPNTLLFVTLSDASHRGGTVEARAPGFLVGYIDRFAPGDNAHDLLLAQWVKLCREAARLRLAFSAASR